MIIIIFTGTVQQDCPSEDTSQHLREDEDSEGSQEEGLEEGLEYDLEMVEGPTEESQDEEDDHEITQLVADIMPSAHIDPHPTSSNTH